MLDDIKKRRRIEWLKDAPVNGGWYDIGRNRKRLRAAVLQFAEKHDAPERLLEAIANMLERQALSACSGNMPYGTALIHVINDYYAWGAKSQTDTITLLTYLEVNGFQYPRHAQTLKLLDDLWTASRTAHMEMADPKAAPPTHRAEIMKLINGFSAVVGWSPSSQSGADVPLSSPELPGLAVEIMREHLPDLDVYSNVALGNNNPSEGMPSEVATIELWLIMRAMEQAGISQSLMRAFFKSDPLNLFVGMTLLKNELIHKRVLVELLNYPIENNDWIERIRAWVDDGCPGTILGHKSERDQVPVPAPKIVSTTARTAPEGKQRPTGNKRRHWNFQGDGESVEIDWDQVAGKLETSDLLPLIDEELARAVLVHGLLRQGERVADLSSYGLKKAKLWKAGRRGLSGVSKREFESTVGQLVQAKVITFKRGVYSLAMADPRFPKASELTGRLRALRSSLAR